MNMYKLFRILFLFMGIAGVLLACPEASSSEDDTSGIGTDISTLTLSYANVTGLVGEAIQESVPTWIGGTPLVTYAIAPTLPAGLSINAGTGVISGTPAPGTVQAATPYTVTATGAGLFYNGTQTAPVTITITDTGSQIHLDTFTTFSYDAITSIENTAFAGTGPTWGDGDAPTATYTIAPTLPAGLSIDAGTGIISGTPTVAQVAQDYTVTATGRETYTGTRTATVRIAVLSAADGLFARWKASSSYAAITPVNTGTAIGTVDELKNIQNNLTGTYYLTSNIDVSGVAWEPLGSITNPFSGILYGNGYIVHGLKIEATDADADQGKYQGLFAVINHATVQDVGIGVELISAVERVGAVAGEAQGTSKIRNVAVAPMVNTAKITASALPTHVGGVVGVISGIAEVSNAYNLEMKIESTVTGLFGDSYAGGLVGRALTTNKIHGYTFTGNVAQKMIYGKDFIGGLVGAIGANTEVRGFVSGAGEIAGNKNIGGLVGGGNSGNSIQGYFEGGTVSGIDNQRERVGGLVGTFQDNSENIVTGYVANATITGTLFIGGLVGWAYTGTISGYVTDTTITATGNYVGGFAGQIYRSSRTFISGSVVNTDQDGISGAEHVGGFVGRVWTSQGLVGNARLTGYVATSITATGTMGVFSSMNNATVITGHWDERATGIADDGFQGGTGISDIANIVYDGTTGVYTDSGKGNVAVFDNAVFLTQFSGPEASATPPDVRPYRILPFGITMGVNGTVNFLDVAPLDNTDTVTWSSSNAAVVSVDTNGLATAQGTGSATITATWSGGGTATMNVTVQ